MKYTLILAVQKWDRRALLQKKAIGKNNKRRFLKKINKVLIKSHKLGTRSEKKRDYVGKIPKWRTPSPLPPVWEFSHFFTAFFAIV